MKSIVKISILLSYIIFAQVYPIVHWHAQEHHDKVELQLSVHPPEVGEDDYDQHNHTDEHEHEDVHFEGDWDYTLLAKTFSFIIFEQQLPIIEILIDEPQVLNRKPNDIPLKLPHHYLQTAIPDRAPPLVS